MNLPSPINLFSYPPQKSAAALRKFLSISRYASSFSLRLARFLRRPFENILIGDGIKNIAPILAGLLIAMGAGVFVAHAQTYAPLAPLPIGEGGALLQTYTLSSYLSGVIKLLIALGAATAILFAIIGGTQYVAASINPSAKKDALERIWGALIGLAIILTSYIVLDSINPDLVNLKFSLPPVQVAVPTGTGGTIGGPGIYECRQEVVIPALTAQGFTCTKAAPGADCYIEGQQMYKCIEGTWANDNEVRTRLTSAGINVKSPTCTNYGQGLSVEQGGVGGASCTSVYGLPEAAISGLSNLKQACNCDITVTGGTESWLHKSHGPGWSQVDIRIDSGVLDAFIITQAWQTTAAKGEAGIFCGVKTAPHYKISNRNYAGMYVYETSHWHICY